MHPSTLAFFSMPGTAEWIVIGIIALLVFGRRLPDVARSLGKSIVEFKRGIRDVKDDIDVESRQDRHTAPKLEDRPSPARTSAAIPDVAGSGKSVRDDHEVGSGV